MGESKLDLTQRFRLAQRHIVLFSKELPCLRRFEYRLAYSMLDFHLGLESTGLPVCAMGLITIYGPPELASIGLYCRYTYFVYA
jgi:hypothetical protein